MPRIARVVAVGVPHHVTQRGNNRQQVFFSDTQRRYYLALLGEHAVRSGLGILGYCLMPNHVHAIVTPATEVSMAQSFGRTHNAYARQLNALRRRSGHLWQNRFYSTPMDEAHLLRALQYVDLNPVRARLVERATDYRWSSAKAHVEGRDPAGLIDFDQWQRICRTDGWLEALDQVGRTDECWVQQFHASTRAGKPLGNKEFVDKLENQLGTNLELRRPGRPRKKPLTRAAGA